MPSGKAHTSRSGAIARATVVSQNSGKCLTTDGVAGDQLYQFSCVGSPLQKWQSDLGNFTQSYGTITNPHTGLKADVNGGSRWAGAKLIGWYPNGGNGQQFGYYQLF